MIDHLDFEIRMQVISILDALLMHKAFYSYPLRSYTEKVCDSLM